MATGAQNPLADEPEEDEIELDLVAEDAALRDEVVGKPMRIRLSTGVITVPHIKTWRYEDTRWLDMGQFSMWADAVLSEEDAKIWHDADLENYQVDKIVAFMLSKAGATPGKSRGSSNSRSGRRRR
jgi:hypothetical protein